MSCLGAVRLGQRADEDVFCAVDLPRDDGGAEGVDGAFGAPALSVLQQDHFRHLRDCQKILGCEEQKKLAESTTDTTP